MSSYLLIAASVDVAATVDPNGVQSLSANGLSTVPIKGNQVFSNGPTSLPENPPDYLPILCNWVSDNFILADEPFAKAIKLRNLCIS